MEESSKLSEHSHTSLVRGNSSQTIARGTMNKTIFKYLQFCIVGGTGLVGDMTLLFILSEWFTWHLTLSKLLAAEAALLNNFFWNDVWTFRDSRGSGCKTWCSRLSKFHLVCLSGIALSVAFLHLQVQMFGWNVFAANFLSIVLSSLWNFAANAKFSWSSKRSLKTRGAPHGVWD